MSAIDRIERALEWGDFDGVISWGEGDSVMVEDLRTQALAALADLRALVEAADGMVEALTGKPAAMVPTRADALAAALARVLGEQPWSSAWRWPSWNTSTWALKKRLAESEAELAESEAEKERLAAALREIAKCEPGHDGQCVRLARAALEDKLERLEEAHEVAHLLLRELRKRELDALDEVARLAAALREIENFTFDAMDTDAYQSGRMKEIARAALGKEQ